jgi:hypothetical protein
MTTPQPTTGYTDQNSFSAQENKQSSPSESSFTHARSKLPASLAELRQQLNRLGAHSAERASTTEAIDPDSFRMES